MTDRKDRIMAKVKKHYDFAKEYCEGKGYKLVAVCLYGSQNYELDDENSDVDTKAFVIPNKSTIYFDNWVSIEHHFEDNEHCEIKDIRFLYKELAKGSPNMIECLFTDFYIAGRGFGARWKSLRYGREVFARLDPVHTIRALCGMGLRRNQKKEYHKFRVLEAVQKYIDNKPYEMTLVPTDSKEKILRIKKGEEIPTEEEMLEVEKKLLEYSRAEYNFGKMEAPAAFLKKTISNIISQEITKET